MVIHNKEGNCNNLYSKIRDLYRWCQSLVRL